MASWPASLQFPLSLHCILVCRDITKPCVSTSLGIRTNFSDFYFLSFVFPFLSFHPLASSLFFHLPLHLGLSCKINQLRTTEAGRFRFRNNPNLIWSICMHNIHHIFKKNYHYESFSLHQPPSSSPPVSIAHAHVKAFPEAPNVLNWICFSSRRRSGPRRTRSAASEELVTSLSLRWKPNDTCPSLTSLSWHLWELVKFSEDLSWELGNHLWVQKWHHSVRKWNLLKMANISLPHQLLPVTSS